MTGEAVVVVERGRPECSQCYTAARWTHRHGCGFDVYACDLHRVELDYRNAPGTAGFLTCRGCGHFADQPMPWRLL